MSDGTRKIGDGHAAAMARLGLRELRELGNPGGNVTQHPEYGLYGTLTPGEVAESRRGDERDLDRRIEPRFGSGRPPSAGQRSR